MWGLGDLAGSKARCDPKSCWSPSQESSWESSHQDKAHQSRHLCHLDLSIPPQPPPRYRGINALILRIQEARFLVYALKERKRITVLWLRLFHAVCGIFCGHSISKWRQLPWWRQINLFPTPAGNSVPLGLTGPEREGVRVILPNAPSRDNDLAMLTCCGCREDEMACHSRGVQSCLSLVGVQNGVYRRVEGIPSCFGVEFLSKRALEGKTSGNLVDNSVLVTFFSLLLSFLCCSSP